MILSPEAIAAFSKILHHPKDYDMSFRPFPEMWEPAETARANHLLFEDFQAEVPNCPKLVFYIIMNEIHGLPCDKDEEGRLGYKIRYKPV